MKKFLALLLTAVLLQACTSGIQNPSSHPEPEKPPVTAQPQTPAPSPQETPGPEQPQKPTETKQPAPVPATYSNDIFKDVSVQKIKDDTYEVKGKAQVFEAVANYVVEDGHNELTEGSVQTSAGAPAWGDFSFPLKVKKAEPNSTLTLIMFESSAKDGSRRMELPIPLPE